MHRTAVAVAAAVLIVALVTAGAVPAAIATPVVAQSGSAEAYSGTHVEFDTEDGGIVDYRLDGESLFDSVATESRSAFETRTDARFDGELATVSGIAGASTSIAARSATHAAVETGGSATMNAYDSERGHLVIEAGGDAQLVEVRLAGDAEAHAEDDSRVVVTRENGTQGAFIVVGDGSVTVNRNGDVTVELRKDDRVVFRSSGDERTADDAEQERLIAEGAATAETYVTADGDDVVVAAVEYATDTSVKAANPTGAAIELTVDRTTDEGTIVLTTVDEAAVGPIEGIAVSVDGAAATPVTSYGELEAAADGGDGPAFAVANEGNASADVLVAVDHFSERSVTVTGGDESAGDDGGSAVDDQPGFGVGVALIALLSALLAWRQG